MAFLASEHQFGYGLNVLGNGTYIYNRNDERIGFGFTAGFDVVYEGESYKEWGRLYLDTNQNGIYEGIHLYDESSGINPSQIGTGGEGIDHHFGYWYSINYTKDRDNVVDVWSHGVSGFSGLDGYGVIEITSELIFDTTSNDDFYIATTNDDQIDGLNGNDTFLGRSGNDRIDGGQGNDYLNGGLGNDFLHGGNGSDNLVGGFGNDQLAGGAGIDTAVFSSRNNRVNLSSNTRQDTGDGRDILTGIENVNGGDGNDIITGNDSVNALYGGKGNDFLNGGEGNDQLIGGAGIDTAIFGSINNKIDLTKKGRQNTREGKDILSSIENVKGGNGNDIIKGNTEDNYLYGEAGKDLLIGGAGNDQLNGGAGNDRLNGGNNNDRLFGKDGNDVLIGGKGADTFNGGEGNNKYIGGDGADRFCITRGLGRDIIKDYTSSEDKIKLLGDLTESDLNIRQAGDNVKIKFEGDLMALVQDVLIADLTFI